VVNPDCMKDAGVDTDRIDPPPPAQRAREVDRLSTATTTDNTSNRTSGSDVTPTFTEMEFEEASCCATCDVEFSFFTRRHHCRQCRRSFCDSHCTPVAVTTLDERWLFMCVESVHVASLNLYVLRH
jgi:hypothetical protein